MPASSKHRGHDAAGRRGAERAWRLLGKESVPTHVALDTHLPRIMHGHGRVLQDLPAAMIRTAGFKGRASRGMALLRGICMRGHGPRDVACGGPHVPIRIALPLTNMAAAPSARGTLPLTKMAPREPSQEVSNLCPLKMAPTQPSPSPGSAAARHKDGAGNNYHHLAPPLPGSTAAPHKDGAERTRKHATPQKDGSQGTRHGPTASGGTTAADKARPLNMAAAEAAALFEAHTAVELRAVERRLRAGIEQKREELRQMVGERYRDLIEAADTIADMRLSADRLLSAVTGLQRGKPAGPARPCPVRRGGAIRGEGRGQRGGGGAMR